MADHRVCRDGGFTLVEVIVAFSIFAISAAALLPLLLVSAKAAGSAKMQTQAKNIAQQQIERMRNLAFHVDHQNGDYVDLLDLYYTDLTTSPSALTASTARSALPYGDADGSVRVAFLSDAGGVGGRPSGPAYRVDQLQLNGYPGFSLEVYTQFLRTTRGVVAPPTTYTSQTASMDSPPTQLVGVTVLTTWTDNNGASSYRTYTEMAEGRGAASLLATQARATAIRVTGTDSHGGAFLAQAAVVQADGSVTSGSSAAAAAESARLEEIGVETSLGRTMSAAAPTTPGTPGPSSVQGGFSLDGGSGVACGWGSVGQTQVADVTATTGTAQPMAPADGGTDVRVAGAKRIQAGVLVAGSGCSGYNFAVRPDTDGAWSPPVSHGVNASVPLVGLRDTSGTSLANAAALAKGQIAASPLVSLPIFSSARAEAMTKTVEILPVPGFSNGLVRLALNSSALTCVSGTATAGSYSVSITHPTGTANRSWSSTGSGVAPLPDPATINFSVNGVPHTLADYLSWEVASGLNEGDNGVSSFGPVLRVTIKAAAIGTATDLTIELGVLSCAADDRR